MNRRTFLGASALAGIGLAGCGSSQGPHAAAPPRPTPTPTLRASAAHPSPGRLVHGSFVSAKRAGKRTGWTISYPPSSAPGDQLPVLIALHAFYGDNTSPFTELHLDHYLADAVAKGMPPYAIASVDGGRNRYWHKRDPDDPGAMVLDEFIPLLGRHGLQTDRVALFGWSMGGYGALYLASVLGRQRVASVGAESPSVWDRYTDVAAGAFDGPADYAAHSLFARVDQLRGMPIRIDLGQYDYHVPEVARLRSEITPRPAGGVVAGAHHGPDLWRHCVPAQLAFAGAHLHR